MSQTDDVNESRGPWHRNYTLTHGSEGTRLTGPLCRTKGRIFSPYHFPPWGWNGSSDLWGILRMTWAERGNFFQWPGRCTEIGLLTKCKGVCLGLTNSISHPIPGGHFNNAAWQGTLAKQNAISELLVFWKEEISGWGFFSYIAA